MTKMIPCPIERCKYKGHKESGLFAHLYNHHRKEELIKALLREVRRT